MPVGVDMKRDDGQWSKTDGPHDSDLFSRKASVKDPSRKAVLFWTWYGVILSPGMDMYAISGVCCPDVLLDASVPPWFPKDLVHSLDSLASSVSLYSKLVLVSKFPITSVLPSLLPSIVSLFHLSPPRL